MAAYKGSPWGLSLEELLEQEEQQTASSSSSSDSASASRSLTPKSHFVPRVMRAILQYLESAAAMVPEGSGADWGEGKELFISQPQTMLGNAVAPVIVWSCG